MAEKVLMTLDRSFEKDSENTTFFYEFEVAEDFRQLQISFEYTPKRLEDLEIIKPMVEKALQKYLPPPFDEAVRQGKGALAGIPLERIPVVNLLTVSLDDSYGNYIGCAHRHPNFQNLFVSANESSPGFCAVSLDKGTWRLGLQIHAVVTEEVDVKICVKGVN